ncbi:MAG: DNA internalization-related competence protein ComEC/Rec2 [bacterium]|nr:DNA internalization-related competence protein ComEC/Rec2 [bacterium]
MKTVPAVKLALIIALGIYLGDRIGYREVFTLWVLALLILALAILLRRTNWATLAAYAALLFLGICSSANYSSKLNSLSALPQTAVFWGGKILAEESQSDDRRAYIFRPDWYSIDGKDGTAYHGRIRLILSGSGDSLKEGDRVVAFGKLESYAEGHDAASPDWRKIFSRRGISGWMNPEEFRITRPAGINWLVSGREAIKTAFSSSLPPQYAGLITGMVLGDQQSVPEEIRNDFRQSGLYHLLAVSGLNIGFLTVLLGLIIAPLTLNLRLRRLIFIIAVWGYTLLTGASPATLRAALMVTLVLISFDLRRVPRSWNLWGGAALIILLFSPQQLFMPGFQLSFAATAGVLLALDCRRGGALGELPNWQRWRRVRSWLDHYLTTPLLVSVCAVIFTAPILTANFGSFAPIAVPLNLLAIPIAGAVFALGWVHLIIYWIFGMTIYPLIAALELGLRSMGYLASLGSGFGLNIPGGMMTAAALVIVLLGVLFSRRWRQRFIWILGGAALVLIFSTTQKSPYLQIECIDVGQGDAILLRFPGDVNVLVDCGEKKAAKLQLIPALTRQGVSHLNDFVLTHYDDDHCGGATEIISSLHVDRVLVSSMEPTSDLGQSILSTARQRSIEVRALQLGDTIAGLPGTKCVALWPIQAQHGEENGESIVLKLTYGATDVLLTADVGREQEQVIESAGDYLQCEVLKVAHHGSKASADLSFLRQVKPQIALISVGERNRYGHPSEQTLADLQHENARIYRTDRQGSLIFASDGKSIWQVK